MSNGFPDSDRTEGQSPKPAGGEVISILAADETERQYVPRQEPFVISTSGPGSMAETVRKSGLAYSAGIAFFASVVFMLVIGWGADLLFGSSPWGIVGGIVLGSIIGFVQFFRITSRIFKPEKGLADPNPLFHGKDLEK